jgi:hypothetical protein
VPNGFFKNGGFAYLADRGTTNNPHPGTDSILRLSSAQLAVAGVRDGDLVVATEGGGTTVDVTCAASCSLRPIGTGAPVAHIEGHVVFLANQVGQASPAGPPPSPHPKPSAPAPAKPKTNLAGVGLAGVGILIFLAALMLAVRRGRPS